MSMSHHISHICTTVTFYLRNIVRIRRFIDQSACHSGVRSLVLSHPSRPLLSSLHWLPLKHRIMFKLLSFVYKILNNQAPKYLGNCLNLYRPTRALRSASDPLRLTYSITRTLAGDRTFTVTASKYWYDLPLSLRQSSSVAIFRKALKTHLFCSL